MTKPRDYSPGPGEESSCERELRLLRVDMEQLKLVLKDVLEERALAVPKEQAALFNEMVHLLRANGCWACAFPSTNFMHEHADVDRRHQIHAVMTGVLHLTLVRLLTTISRGHS